MPAINQFLQQLFSALTTFPGNLTYHLVLAFAIAGALFSAYNHWQTSGFPQGRRVVIGLGLLLAVRLAFFIFSGVMDPSLQTTKLWIPPLDRALSTITLLIIVWLWAFPEPARTADAATILVTLLVTTFSAFTIVSWSAYLATNRALLGFFNSAENYIFNTAWESTAIALAALGVFLLLVRRPNGWVYGLTSLFFLFAGHLAHLIWPAVDSDLPGAVRLAQLAAIPLLLTLPLRFPLPESRSEAAADGLTIEKRSYNTSPETFRAFVELTTEKSAGKICQALTKTVSALMLADISLLLTPPDETGELTLECGYDLIRQQSFGGTRVNSDFLPVIHAALRKGRSLRLPASSTSPDLKNLAQILGLERSGHLVVAPIKFNNQAASAGLILISPYSNRGWTGRDEEYLLEITSTLAQIAGHNYRIGVKQKELSETRERLSLAESQIERLLHENQELKHHQEQLQVHLPADATAAESMAELLKAQETAQDTIERLQAELDRLRIGFGPAGTDQEDLAGELQSALAEVGVGQGLQPEEGSSGPAGYASSNGERLSDSQAEVIASLAQELRQPMSSVTGYTDLLLSESVGILGTLQVKFLERIKASVERMRTHLDDLIQITALDQESVRIVPEQVNLAEVIDEAIAFTRSQLSENNIILRVDLPAELPELHADRDALQQILIHLLQNAGAVTPREGEIALHAHVEDQVPDRHVMIQVTDSGGGIPESEQERVFSRLYRADKALIQGVGDTGVGLALAKALVEAHDGQIWVDSHEGSGSCFSVKLPFNHSNARPPEAAGGPT